MDDFEATRELAHQFVLEHDIKSPCIGIPHIIDIIKSYEFPVFTYAKGMHLIEKCESKEKTTYLVAFTYIDYYKDNEGNDKVTKYVFYDDTFPEHVIHEALLHELAHVYMESFTHIKAVKGQYERGTRELALQINSPMCVLKKYNPQNVEEIISLAKITKVKAEVVWEHLGKYEIVPEDKPILNQYSDFINYRNNDFINCRALFNFCKRFMLVLSLEVAALTICLFYLLRNILSFFL